MQHHDESQKLIASTTRKTHFNFNLCRLGLQDWNLYVDTNIEELIIKLAATTQGRGKKVFDCVTWASSLVYFEWHCAGSIECLCRKAQIMRGSRSDARPQPWECACIHWSLHWILKNKEYLISYKNHWTSMMWWNRHKRTTLRPAQVPHTIGKKNYYCQTIMSHRDVKQQRSKLKQWGVEPMQGQERH